jgi:hypothetical protein
MFDEESIFEPSEEINMKPTKEQALEYIKKRYPEQKEIWAEYLKPRKPLVVPHA